MKQIRFANLDDLSWISSLEKQNYLDDAWNYSAENWAKQIKIRDPAIWIKVRDKIKFNSLGGNVIWIYEKSYLQFSLQPRYLENDLFTGGYYLTSFGGKNEEVLVLFDGFLNLQKSGRFYTHAKSQWFEGNAFNILENFGFKNKGPGNNKREIGKWKMDLSKLTEFELLK